MNTYSNCKPHYYSLLTLPQNIPSHSKNEVLGDRLLDEIGNVLRHLFHLRRIIRFNVSHRLHIIASHEVYAHTLATVATGPPNAMQVVLYVQRQIVVDDQ